MTQKSDTISPAASTSCLSVLGVRVHDLTRADVARLFTNWLVSNEKTLHQVVTVNPEFIMAARRDAEFRDVLQNSDLSTADGIGVVLAARVLGSSIRERLTGVDLTETLATMREPAPRMFLLGAGPGIARQAGERLRERHPDIVIAGSFSGSPGDADYEPILEAIRKSRANTLLVAFGAPAQEKWISARRHDLAACGIVIAIGVGGTFDYLAGNVKRAPGWIRRIGLEWFYRLVRQPWRWRRQLALPHFVLLVLRERLFGKA